MISCFALIVYDSYYMILIGHRARPLGPVHTVRRGLSHRNSAALLAAGEAAEQLTGVGPRAWVLESELRGTTCAPGAVLIQKLRGGLLLFLFALLLLRDGASCRYGALYCVTLMSHDSAVSIML